MIYIICCNDTLKWACESKSIAESVLEDIKKNEADETKYWHIHEVELIK